MLTIDPELVLAAQSATTAAELIPLVEHAIAIEHATIPLYFTAFMTLDAAPPDAAAANADAAAVIREIMLDEMLHMGLMANLLIALGGNPRFADAALVPNYHDGELPFGIGNGLKLNLRKCDLAQVDVFIAIEKPEHLIPVPDAKIAAGLTALDAVVDLHFDTIGAFYAALRDSLSRLGAGEWGDPRENRQVDTDIDGRPLTKILTIKHATDAIDLIRLQGEGATPPPGGGPDSPFAAPDMPAHYYAFEQIRKGKHLHVGPDGPEFGPAALPFDPTVVVDMEEGVTPTTYPAGSPARAKVEQFVGRYSLMLRRLESAFNGSPDDMDAAATTMSNMRGIAKQLLALDSPTSPGKKAGLVFAYTP